MSGSGDRPAFPEQFTSDTSHAINQDIQSISSTSTGSRRRGRPRKNSNIQHELSTSGSSVSTGAKGGRKANLGQRRRVGRPSKGSDSVSQQTDDSMLAPSETNSSEDGPVQVGRHGYKGSKGKGKGKGKSALRPKTTLLSMKSARGYSGDPFDDNDVSEELAIGEIQDNSPSVFGGHVSSSKRKLAVLGASTSRNNINNDIDYPNKRPASRDSLDTSYPRDSDITNHISSKIDLPLKKKDPNTPSRSPANDSLLVPPLITTPIPELEPNGPGGSWSCTFDGCMHRVYGANAEVGRQLIREHYGGHVVEKQAQIELVMREERPHLPVK